ncbi:MAG TPA: hypothetical protein VLX59_17065, partial [Acidimicrobiales bacterium]|nr:hypothetical protein [Acidimicrobiales bacterium]
MKWRFRGVAVLAGAAALVAALAGCGGGAHRSADDGAHAASATAPTAPTSTMSPTTAVPSVAPVHWTSCRGTAGPVGFQCATVMVRRDPFDAGLGTIGMAIDRRPASGSADQRIGSLLVNPGGPGESGVDALPGIVSGMPSDVLKRFDVVGFDPPG